MRKARSAFRARIRSLRGPESERGSLPMAMLVMLVGIGLSAAFAPMAINQRKATTFDMARVHALNAAQAGMDVTVGKIRAAIGNQGGDPSKLPCTVSADQSTAIPVTGVVGTGTASYSVLLQYYVSDPVAHPAAVPMRCVSGYGTYDTASGSVVPSYVKLTSTGTDGSSANGGTQGRTLTAVYSFDVDNSNISGGIIRSYPASADGAAQWCLDVGSGTPTAGVTQVSLQTCSTSFPADPQQVFAYRTDLTLQLTTSIGTVVNGVTYRNGLCIDDATFNSGSTAPASGTTLVLKQCGALGSPVWSQQWSFDDHSSLQAPTSSTAGNGTLSGLCMTVTSHAAGVPVKLAACDNVLTSPTDAWIPSPAVGAGAATSPTSNQWINFQQFGRCINVPNNDPNALYIIAPGCKQNPRQASVSANQKFYYDTTRKWFYVTLSGTNWCLYSSNTAYAANSTVGRILATRCTSPASGISAGQLQWTRTTPATDPTLSYSQQYRFIDTTGLCMSLATMPSVPGDTYGSTFSVWPKLVTATCDLSTLQQWNASNNVGNSSIQNQREN
ncbi:MAG: RICIN domain-containing protein [Actinobacteria bacterium]|nr:RICIN domain-containing protein [Actinomycetota bacterium]